MLAREFRGRRKGMGRRRILSNERNAFAQSNRTGRFVELVDVLEPNSWKEQRYDQYYVLDEYVGS